MKARLLASFPAIISALSTSVLFVNAILSAGSTTGGYHAGLMLTLQTSVTPQSLLVLPQCKLVEFD